MDKKVLVGVPTPGYSRNDHFYDYFNMLEKPVDTAITFARGQSPARNRNLIIKQALQYDRTHILFLDDDLAFAPDLLIRLMKHDVDMVTALYLMRNYPHKPIIFDYADEIGRCGNYYPKDTDSGLIPIVAAGLGACLINTDVFRKLEEPWVRLGELEKDHWCDDIGFFRRTREAGFQLYCDLDVVAGHMANVVIWPQKKGGVWTTIYDTSGEGHVQFSAVRPNGIS